MWSCVPQKLWTSYLHSLSSPWTTDQRQGGIWWLPPHSLPPPFLFVFPLSVSLTPLLPFPSYSLYHPLRWSLAFFPSPLPFIILTDLQWECCWWLMWIDGRSSDFATTVIKMCVVYMSLKINPCTFKGLIRVEFFDSPFSDCCTLVGLFWCFTSKPT